MAEKSAENSAEASEPKSGKKKLLTIGILGAVVVAAAAAGAFVFLSDGDEKTPEALTAESSEQAETSPEEVEAETTEQPEEVQEGSEPSAEGETASTEGEEKPSGPPIDFGDTYDLEIFHLNLGNALENRYVRLQVSLEYSGGENQKAEIEKRMPQLRDAVISIISRKTREFLLAPDGKDTIRREILIRINRYMTQKIDSVYITDILIE